MFSTRIKHEIAEKVQTILQEVIDNELPYGEISFVLHVDGAENWSWANIHNNGCPDEEMNVFPAELIKNLTIRK